MAAITRFLSRRAGEWSADDPADMADAVAHVGTALFVTGAFRSFPSILGNPLMSKVQEQIATNYYERPKRQSHRAKSASVKRPMPWAPSKPFPHPDPQLAAVSAVWPFETGWAAKAKWLPRHILVLHAEIYPSITDPFSDDIKDRGQGASPTARPQ